MIVIRGQELTLQPLKLFEMAKVLDSLMALSTCKTLGDQLRPEMREHLLNVDVLKKAHRNGRFLSR